MIGWLRGWHRRRRARKRALHIPIGRIITITEDEQGIRMVWEPTPEMAERIARAQAHDQHDLGADW